MKSFIILVILFASAFAAGDFFGGIAGAGGSVSYTGSSTSPVTFSAVTPANGGWTSISSNQFKTTGAGKVNFYVKASVVVSGCPTGSSPQAVAGIRLVRIDGAIVTQVWGEAKSNTAWTADAKVGGGTLLDLANVNSVYQLQAYTYLPYGGSCTVQITGAYLELDEPISL